MNTINQLEWINRVNQFLIQVKTEQSKVTAEQTTEMFLLYNDRLKPRETGRSCGSCRLRVYRRVKSEYEKLISMNE